MVAAATKKDYPSWEYDLLTALGAPQNKAQLDALNLWAASEGMPASTNNFLAITDPGGEFGATGGDPAGALATGVWNYDSKGNPLVVTFASLSSGLNALVSFLQHGHQGIIDALRDQNATVESIRSAVAADGAWGGDAFARGARTSTAQTGIYRGGSPTGVNGAVAGLGSSTFYQCNSSNTIIGEGGIVFGIGKATLLNPCQAKAITGGLIVGFGFIVMMAGVILTTTTAVKTLGLGDIGKEIGKAFGQAQAQTFGRGGANTTATTTAPTTSRRSSGEPSDRMLLERILNNQWADRNPFPRESA